MIHKVSKLFENRWTFIILPWPIIGVFIFVDVMGMDFIRATGGWSMFAYIFFLIYGYLVYSNQKIQQTIGAHRLFFLVFSLVFSVILVVVLFGIQPELSEGTPVLYLLMTAIRVYCSMSWIFCFIGYSEKYLNFNNQFLPYANQAVLPFYILHQLIILLIGYFVVQWDINSFVKYLIIAMLSFGTIMILYEFLVRRIVLLRILFGMKPERRQTS